MVIKANWAAFQRCAVSYGGIKREDSRREHGRCPARITRRLITKSDNRIDELIMANWATMMAWE